MLLYASLEQDNPLNEVRTDLSIGLIGLSAGHRLQGLFRCIISYTLEPFQAVLGEMTETIMAALNENIHAFFTQALQLDHFTLALEARPDAT